MKVVLYIFLSCAASLALGFEDKTIVEWLESNQGFSTLLTAIKATGLTGALSGQGPFTLLAPTDDAFGKLGTDNVNSLLNNTYQLSWILKFHVIPEFLVVPMITSATTRKTLSSGQLSIAPINGGLMINNYSNVTSARNDIIVNNGVIQPITNVLVPQSIPTFTITQYLIEHDSEFIDLTLALFLANLTSTLDHPTDTFTMFAPVDSAFGVYKNNILSPTQPNALRLYQAVLTNHVVKGMYMASQLSDGQVLTTLHGTQVKISISSSVQVDNSTVIDCTNGVIHAIDAILQPTDIYQTAQGVKVDNSTVIDTDMICTNGVIHAVDAILVPTDILQIAQG